MVEVGVNFTWCLVLLSVEKVVFLMFVLFGRGHGRGQVALQGPVCVEEYSSCRALGRVFLRASGRTIALGVVTQIIKREK